MTKTLWFSLKSDVACCSLKNSGTNANLFGSKSFLRVLKVPGTTVDFTATMPS